MEKNEALKKFLLRLGDTALIQGHRLSEWCSKGPMLEEDIALSNLALDNIGRAQAFLDYAGQYYPSHLSADDLAFRRSERQYYNCLMAELPIGHFGYTIAKQLFITGYEELLFDALTQSTDDTIAAIAHKAIKEARYHFSHAADWCVRLGLGTAESHDKLAGAIADLWSYTDDFFEMTDGYLLLLQLGVAPDMQQLKKLWTDKMNKVFMRAGYVMPEPCHQYEGSLQGLHTEYLGHLLCEMQYLQRAHPQAKW